ncbi:glycosyltransferase [Luteibaculum oceani]|uniref:Glycosyltransferase family 4 protein n=1 Tax=Luteibaculum oceani TaxID=1294296 RepID=A0A5C6V092_9FLAO|nr:glycosyltransferase [Luteibaculum oceani]TXC78314.1 glycosyltransferase family 4 protein [Luteibaculum oceani]
MDQRSIIFLVSNDISTDARLHRTVRALSQAGYACLVNGRKLKSSPSVPQDIAHKRYKLWFNSGFLFYLFLNLKFALSIKSSRSSLIYANDTDSLLGAYLGKLFSSRRIIFDAHEYFSEVPELQGKPLKQKLWQRVEELVIPKASICITVSNLVAKAYEERFQLKFHVIRNINDIQHSKLISIQLPDQYILYQGVLNLGRGIELMIDSLNELDESIHLVIVGTGDIEKDLKVKAELSPNNKRIHFTGRLSPEEVHGITEKALLGLSLEEDLGFNYRAALPNKIFSYLHAEIPCVCSALPEMSSLVLSQQIGEVVEDRTPESVAKTIQLVLSKREAYLPHIVKAKQEINWAAESEKLVGLINHVQDIS